jgi:endonuclease/exonuclease/phosphatase family metal-dependent hydrolase
MKKIIITLFATILIGGGLIFSLNGQKNSSSSSQNGTTFTVASYNLENAFDLVANGTEYAEFIPNFKGWDKESFEIKFSNSAKVIADMKPDIIALEEIENENALNELKKRLNARGSTYAYSAITTNQQSAVQVALLSKYKIVETKEIKLERQRRERPILKVTIDIGGKKLIVYANHWKAKTGPESHRLEYARELMRDISKLDKDTDYIILGDLNSNYNEFETIQNDARLNDTAGVTAINDLLETTTIKNGKKRVAEKVDVIADDKAELKYNLWLEVPKNERMSEAYSKERDTPDNIIIPKAMFDKKGVNYVDGSFAVFAPSYLLDEHGRPYRWNGKDRKNKIPHGYSDHLPIIAKFCATPFVGSEQNESVKQSQAPQNSLNKKVSLKQIQISDIYDKNISGPTDMIVKDVAVIHSSKNGVVVKQKNSRAIFVYNPQLEMKLGYLYNIRVTNIEDYKGLKEIKNIFDSKENGKTNIAPLLLKYSGQDLSDKQFQNEIVTGLSCYISRGKLVYANDKEIKIFFSEKKLKPKNLSKIEIRSGHISSYDAPQIIISNSNDFAVLE